MKNAGLLLKTALQVLVFFLVFGFFIFLPAGTLRFWQGWVFFAVFCASTLFITAFFLVRDPALIARRIKSGETRKEQKALQAVSGSVFFLGLLVIPGLDQRFSWSDVPDALVIAADAVVLLGFVIVFLVFRINSYTSATIEVSQGQKVITAGVYSLVRHPMYFGAVLILICMPLALNSFWALIPALFICAFVVLRLLDEEKVLLESLDGYEAYCKKTRHRLIPFLW